MNGSSEVGRTGQESKEGSVPGWRRTEGWEVSEVSCGFQGRCWYLSGSKALGHSPYLVVGMLCPQCEQSALGGAWSLSLIWVNMQNDCLSYGPKADRLGGDLCLEATLATVY